MSGSLATECALGRIGFGDAILGTRQKTRKVSMG